ncbi:MAG TPA: hypothetical protein VG734_21355 [Lacunisphaera sp.]|nr:hypothetical protein [Lacunisphaera sp.]
MDAEYLEEACQNFPGFRKIPSTDAAFFCDYASKLGSDALVLLWEYAYASAHPFHAREAGIVIGSRHREEFDRFQFASVAKTGTWQYIGAKPRQRYIAEWRQNPTGLTSGFESALGSANWRIEIARPFLERSSLESATCEFMYSADFKMVHERSGKCTFVRRASSKLGKIEIAFDRNDVQVQHAILGDNLPRSLEASLCILAPADWDLISTEAQLKDGLKMLVDRFERITSIDRRGRSKMT